MSVKYQPIPSNDPYESEIDFSSPFDYDLKPTNQKFRSIFTYSDLNPHNADVNLTSAQVSFWRRFSYWVIIFAAYLLLFITMPISIWFAFKRVPNYERLVIFRLGLMLKTKGPGFVFFLPWIDRCHSVDMRTKAFNVPPQQILVSDGAAIEIGANIYVRIVNVQKSVACVQDHNRSVRLLVQLTLVKLLAKKTLEEIEQQRSSIAAAVQDECNKTTLCWGVEISRCELSHIKVLVAPSEGKVPLPKCIQPPGYTPSGYQGAFDGLPLAFQQLANVVINKTNENSPKQTPVPKTFPTKDKENKYLETTKNAFDVIIFKLQSVLDKDLVQSVNSIFQFHIVGDINKKFILDLKNGAGTVTFMENTENHDAADVNMTLDYKDFISLAHGHLKPLEAYKNGCLKVSGNKLAALRIEPVLDRLQSIIL
ncbi:stomatin-like protein 1 [Octopus bimaculoides]|uniref:Band 7 domain-containing protein n=1 Tax=Octopus bimaculoides TaxID=37653 RepID=A0A0L8GHA7_OCTBM|nr:stomatin-like protein 1 [Octopus bimaculoides]XP_052829154.1 stomatin-like protein 1 [Octopus bimaculoides]|eukprot:XP_014781091.1 PREDICTED: stomatin-like protein 1 [Octopus bimaculoides]